MTLDEIKSKLRSMSDEHVLSLLDAVSDEVKRRNTILGPPIADVRKEALSKGLLDLLEALASGPRSTP